MEDKQQKYIVRIYDNMADEFYNSLEFTFESIEQAYTFIEISLSACDHHIEITKGE